MPSRRERVETWNVVKFELEGSALFALLSQAKHDRPGNKAGFSRVGPYRKLTPPLLSVYSVVWVVTMRHGWQQFEACATQFSLSPETARE